MIVRQLFLCISKFRFNVCDLWWKDPQGGNGPAEEGNMSVLIARACRMLGVSILLVPLCSAQKSPDLANPIDNPSSTSSPQCSIRRLGRCIKNVAADQLGIWTSPFRIDRYDAIWLLPFSVAVGSSVYYDNQAMQKLGYSRSRVDFGRHVSKYTPYAALAGVGATYLVGAVTHNDHVRETGLLGAESVIDAALLTEGLKFATQRDRPYQGNGTGDFWPHSTKSFNTNGSMPSAHAAVTWALARVVSMEFPDRPLLKFAVYGAATTVSLARVMSREHFPSDVLVGSTFGFLIGGYVMRHRSEAYSDNFSFAISPAFDRLSRTYSLSLELTPPANFDTCRLLQPRLLRRMKFLDPSCLIEK